MSRYSSRNASGSPCCARPTAPPRSAATPARLVTPGGTAEPAAPVIRTMMGQPELVCGLKANYRHNPIWPARAHPPPPQFPSYGPHRRSRGHRGAHGHRRAGTPDPTGTTTMPHRGGPDHDEVTLSWFGDPWPAVAL